MPERRVRALVARKHVGNEVGACRREPSVAAARKDAVCADELKKRDFDIADSHSKAAGRGILRNAAEAEGAKLLCKGLDPHFVEKADERNVEREDKGVAHSDEAAIPAVEVRWAVALERDGRVDEAAVWGRKAPLHRKRDEERL